MRIFYPFALVVLLFPSTVIAQFGPPSIEWQKCLGGSGNEKGTDVLLLSDGGYLITGETSSDDGDVTAHYGTSGTFDGWLVRLSAAGSITWQKNIGGTGNDYLKTVIPTGDGNFVAIGTTTSNDGDVTGNHGGTDIWVVKFSENGDLIWNKCYGGSGHDSAGSIVQIPDGSFIVAGSTTSADGDLSGTRNGRDVWYFKIDAAGDLLWGNVLGNQYDDYGEDIRLLPDNNVLFSVEASLNDVDTLDFPMNALATLRAWIVKIDNAGNIIWKNPVGPENFFNFRVDQRIAALQISSYGITVVEEGNVSFGQAPWPERDFALHLANYNGTWSFDTEISFMYTPALQQSESEQILPLSPHACVALPDSMLLVAGNRKQFFGPESKAFIIKKTFKQDTSGASQPGYYGGSHADGFVSIKQIAADKFIAAGFTFSNDGDVSGNHGGSDIWIVRLTDSQLVRKNTIRGLAFIDNNNNNQYDAGDQLFNDLIVESVRQSDHVTISSMPNSGIYFNEVDTGTYNTTVSLHRPYYTSSPVTAVTEFDDYYKSDTVLFALSPIPGKRDYNIILFSHTPARPGFEFNYQAHYANAGTDTMNNCMVEMIKDSMLQFVSAVPAQNYVSGDTIRWVIHDVVPGDSGTIQVQFNLPANAPLGDTLITSVRIDSANDLHTPDNVSELHQTITGSWDPNDKQENRQGILRRNDFDEGSYLTYRIRFQNTGTDTAFNIVVQDTLDDKLDWNTLRMVASSHAYTLQIKDGNKLSWTFADIRLPDSNRNEPASHGYIIYRIQPVGTLAVGDTIHNQASIYFDFNLPVQTNRQQTVLWPIQPPVPELSGLSNNYCATVGVQLATITNLPAAGSGIKATAELDGNALTIGADSTLQLDVTAAGAGAHTLTVQFTNGPETTSYEYEINIEEAVTPDVNVTANITNITNLADPVIVTAVNAGGGGADPLFTFAKDRIFTNILQAQSATAACIVDPSALTIGDNWIYIKMKTSEPCYTTQTSIDSIKLERSAVTGIVDMDFPAQVINVYPNPFKSAIVINGLSPSKTYIVKLFNVHGQQLMMQRVSNRSSVTIPNGYPAQSVYWLSIYDEKRRLLLGSLKLYKQ